MSKLAVLVIGAAAVAAALVLFLLGRRTLHVDEGAARTLRGRFLVAVAFFLAVFAGAVERARAADAPPAATQQRPSLAEMKAAVEQALLRGPIGNDWMDPDIQPNIYAVLESAGLVQRRMQPMCYDRAAVPVQERGAELAALQKQLLDEKVAEGVIPGEVAGKITAIPEPAPGTPAEVRAFQKSVRRAARLLYAAGELDSVTIRKLEAAIAMPIVALDPVQAVKADVTYALQAAAPWNWPADARRQLQEVLAKHGVSNKVTTRRGEMMPAKADEAKALVEKVDKLLGDPKHTVTLKQDEGAKPDVRLSTNPELEAYQLKARHAVRILIAEGVLRDNLAANLSAVLGVPVFGVMGFFDHKPNPEDIPPTCYWPIFDRPEGSSRLTPAERRELRAALNAAGVLDEHTVAKLVRAERGRS